jgi:heme A synthase
VRVMSVLAWGALALTLVVTTASAYIRLEQSAACARATPCASLPSMRASVDAAISGARAVHLLAATAVGVLVLAIAWLCWRQPRFAALRGPCTIAVLLTIFLAALGRQASVASPAIVLGNVSGGMALAAVLAWLGMRVSAPVKREPQTARWLALAGVLAGATIALSVVPGARAMHVIMALATAVVLGAQAVHGPSLHRRYAMGLAALATLQLGIGPALAAGHFPVALGIAHNIAAAALAVGLASLLAYGGSE